MFTTQQAAETVRRLFLDTARVVSEAIADERVGRASNEPSVLADQLVGGVAAHLARGGVWVVDDYLRVDSTLDVPPIESAVQYVVRFVESSVGDVHRQIRKRGALVAADGQDRLTVTLRSRLAELATRLSDEPPGRLVDVAGGTLRMPLDEYLKTRIVEQIVHLDDLARSVSRDPWPTPRAAQDLVLQIGLELGRERHGATEMTRCLYRSRLDPVLPVPSDPTRIRDPQLLTCLRYRSSDRATDWSCVVR